MRSGVSMATQHPAKNAQHDALVLLTWASVRGAS